MYALALLLWSFAPSLAGAPDAAPLAPQTGLVSLVPAAAPRVETRALRTESARAGSVPHEDDFGGFGPSDNRPRAAAIARTGGLFLAIDPTAAPLRDGHAAVRVHLANGSDADIVLPALDSHVGIVQQARLDGHWVPIEAQATTSCGNSCHRLRLPAGSLWTFDLPRYDGDVAVELRFAMDGPSGEIVSASFIGGLTEAQVDKAKKRADAAD